MIHKPSLPKKLPVGIQSFEKLIVNHYTYVDKTELIYQLCSGHESYFLSRPRRFGKSLLISTMNAIFSGQRNLFQGLWIDKSDWNWTPYPVIRLDMSEMNSETPELLERSLIRTLNELAANENITLSGDTPSDYLGMFIKTLAKKQKVVVLVDEYDKPLIDQIDHLAVATANQDILRRFYSVLKTQDEHLRFVFLTGITKFSKVSVFSGLNNLNDLTMLNDFSALLGYTRNELDYYFSTAIKEVSIANKLSVNDCFDQIKEWYNGYRFSPHGALVYNPFSTLKMLQSKEFSAYWFETGTPTFLIKLINQRHLDFSSLDGIDTTEKSFTTFDIENLHTLPLLYQTGYLTIKSVLPEINALTLGFPNREVSQAFSESLLKSFATSEVQFNQLLILIAKNLSLNPWDCSQFIELMQNLLALIPYDLYVKQEKYFHSLFYLIVKLAGFQINAEVHTHQGRLDASLELKEKVIIFEFKMNESAEIAINQIKQKKYYSSYQNKKGSIYLVGINFNGEERLISDWLVEEIQ